MAKKGYGNSSGTPVCHLTRGKEGKIGGSFSSSGDPSSMPSKGKGNPGRWGVGSGNKKYTWKELRSKTK